MLFFICRQVGISRRTFYYYWLRFRREGWKGLGIKSCRPYVIHRTPRETVDLTLELRETRGWGVLQ
ncbi:MAG: hypothetical protein KAU03_06695 [Candidatus Altiarchaeales archaeon]|nr:hypothetical protein [Candidatus Altiarchaeales archaeon]